MHRKSLAKWEAEFATFNKELNQWKEKAQISKEKLIRAYAFISTQQKINGPLKSQVWDLRADKVENEA